MAESVPGWFHQLSPDLQTALIRAPHRVLDADQVQLLSQRSGVVGNAYFVSHGGGAEGFRLAPAVVAGIEAETRRRTAWWNALQPATREGLIKHVNGEVPAELREDALSPRAGTADRYQFQRRQCHRSAVHV